MAKFLLQHEAQELRRQGLGIKTIAKTLQVSRSSVSRWVTSINLTREQTEALLKRSLIGAEVGRLKSGEIRKANRLKFIEEEMNIGRKKLTELSERELFLVGLALYWGEGSKKNGQIQFCNSDPAMVQFVILWLEKCFQIPREELRCWIGINDIHKERDVIIKEYWSKVINIPLSQFNNTSFKRVESKKIYTNSEEYFGTLFIRVERSMRIYHKILGMIDGLGQLTRVAQR